MEKKIGITGKAMSVPLFGERINEVHGSEIKVAMPSPGETFYYRKNTWKELTYQPKDLGAGGMVMIDDEGVHGTEDAVTYLLSNPENWYKMDNLTKMGAAPVLKKKSRQQLRREKRKGAKQAGRTLQTAIDNVNAEDANYKEAKKAQQEVVKMAKSNHKKNAYKRQSTPKVPTIRK